MTHEVRTATLKDAIYVAQNLREADRSELAGLGYSPFQVVLGFLFCKESIAFTNYQGELAGIGGFIPDEEGNAYVWVLCTPALERMGFTFLRRAKKHLEGLGSEYKMLYSMCDLRNKLHHRFLKHMGFKALRTVPQEPYHLHYLEVVKLCAPQ